MKKVLAKQAVKVVARLLSNIWCISTPHVVMHIVNIRKACHKKFTLATNAVIL